MEKFDVVVIGGSHCNFTNNSSIKNFSDSLGFNGRWLISGLSIFGSEDVINFFESKGVKTKIEDNNRVFPKSNKAQDILDSLISYAQEGGVKILTNTKVEKIIKNNNIISKIILSDGKEIIADKFIFARGNNFKSSKLRGDIIFTKKGISGPCALNLSRELTRQANNLDLFLDFFPDKTEEELKLEIKNIIENNKNFSIKNALSLLIIKRFSSYLLDKLNIDISKKAVSINKSEIQLIASILKSSKFTFTGVGGFDEAMISSGGVDLAEVDNKTMNSKIISNLYLVGETLDLDGPTGGYNLQIAWTSAYLAGSSCV